jgi:hypothetical protein
MRDTYWNNWERYHPDERTWHVVRDWRCGTWVGGRDDRDKETIVIHIRIDGDHERRDRIRSLCNSEDMRWHMSVTNNGHVETGRKLRIGVVRWYYVKVLTQSAAQKMDN